MDVMESTLRCCGLNGPLDYDKNDSPIVIGFHQSLPASCCLDQNTCTLDSGRFWLKGCLYAVSKYTLNALHNMGTLMMSSSSITAMSAMIIYIHGLVIGQQFI